MTVAGVFLIFFLICMMLAITHLVIKMIIKYRKDGLLVGMLVIFWILIVMFDIAAIREIFNMMTRFYVL